MVHDISRWVSCDLGDLANASTRPLWKAVGTSFLEYGEPGVIPAPNDTSSQEYGTMKRHIWAAEILYHQIKIVQQFHRILNMVSWFHQFPAVDNMYTRPYPQVLILISTMPYQLIPSMTISPSGGQVFLPSYPPCSSVVSHHRIRRKYRNVK